MSSNPDPSSPAARGAPPSEYETDEDSPAQRPGFFARFFGAETSGTDPDDEVLPDDPSTPQTLGPRLPGISNLRRMRVEDVAIPRAEITSVASDTNLPDLVQVFRDSGLTRLPVYDGTLDEPIGLVHLKDIALSYGFNGGDEPFILSESLRPVLYVPPSMPIGVLLTKMQADRIHMALVIDEYGGVDGLLTIEDLIEQVIGEIEDEHDIEEAQPWIKEEDGAFLALARAPLDEFESEIGLDLVDEEEEEEVDTLGGLVFLLTGRVPARGEVVPHPSGVEFEVIDADPRRIKRLRVRLPSEAAE
ncbi:magnesium/cobalt efflux protein [Jannaschia sp. EhC01]|uniref:CBS domain-containing protein n=1 Tax=Gymnodinialimonas phycosphaerae TaxID=2841589 RepID=A0A975TTN0_9RHOB|nr:transporter associated domain-containing protein [Gymnodinialimonas phycosphaerae]MBY4894778.1 CBS domain-containing protein [Gymnodinialimonas phycosphaerae]OAN70361.1 magnesium/cobalt efflux protein [Jannaschia sp. EhC01]